MTSKVEISHKTIIFTIVLLASIWIVLQIRDILLLLFIAFILMTALRPIVDRLERLRIPRFLGILLSYGVIFGFFGLTLGSSIPSLVAQTSRLVQLVPSVIERLIPYWNIDARAITQQLAPISENLLKFTIELFSNIVTIFTILVFSFYFLLERKNAPMYITSIMGHDAGDKTFFILEQIEDKIGAWVRGQLTLMVIIGVIVYIGLTFLHVDYALPLAILAGALEIIPMIGPFISGAIAVLVALTVSPLLAVVVAAMYFIIQQVENAVIVPLVMRRSIGLSPIITIIALMVGGRFAGVVGSILAVPIFLVIQTIASLFLFEHPAVSQKEKSRSN